ncbi:MAG: hypothetical protein R2685_10465 [Candidatus Nitrosocosmicus sp.]|nr:hypothetical protein [Candidatus Nitrosocosmicus sp.]
MHNEVLTEILEKIEERAAELRAFCPSCGQISLMTFGWVRCPHGCTAEEDSWCDGWEGYTCSNCLNQWVEGYDYHKDDDLIEYNKMRFEQVE